MVNGTELISGLAFVSAASNEDFLIDLDGSGVVTFSSSSARFDVDDNFRMRDDKNLQMGSTADAEFAWETTGNDNLQLGLEVGSAARSGYFNIMQEDASRITIRTSYNLTAVSFCVEELVNEIKTNISGFKCHYDPDFRQKIADSWPQTIDDSQARQDWNWEPQCDLPYIVEDMLENLTQRLT